MTRRNTHPIPAETIGEIQRLREENLTIKEIAARTGVSMQSISRYSGARRDNRSGRERILNAVTNFGPLDLDGLALYAPDIDRHNAIHLVFALSRAGLVTFREERQGNHRLLTNIRATGPTVLHPYVAPPTATILTAVPPVVEETIQRMTTQPYPLIRGLIDRRGQIESAVQLLEQAGLDDVALAALSKIDLYTDLEREAMALLEASGL
jgi:transcriptional regulator with XRE-family HTH domain